MTLPRRVVATAAMWIAYGCLRLARRMLPVRRNPPSRDQWLDGSLTVDRLSSAD